MMRFAALILFLCATGSLLPVQPCAAVVKEEFTSYTQRIGKTLIHFDMIPIEGGRFVYSIDGKSVTLTVKRFWIAKSECTWDELDTWLVPPRDMTAEQRLDYFKTHPSHTRPFDLPPDFGRSGYPAVKITAHMAQTYCKFLSNITGRKYRLPTAVEWEFACRAGANQPNAAALKDHAWFADNSDETTQPVMKKNPNAFGLHDILGNVAEWCTTLDGKPDALRGGSYLTKAPDLHCGLREPFHPDWQLTDPKDPKDKWWLSDAPFAGFRVVREE
jgi:formylglycine-generating enzyme required for sulfatase activity